MKKRERMNTHVSENRSSLSESVHKKQRQTKWQKFYKKLPLLTMGLSLGISSIFVKDVFLETQTLNAEQK